MKALALASVAALALSAAPASAGPHWRGGGWGHHGWGGPAFVFGVAGAALAAGILAADDPCLRYAPVYDQWGHVVGRRVVNAC